MHILKARFTNFRLLRDLELSFAHEGNKRLTVIRAANETGKTTILTALQWALYGDAALPDKGAGYRLHPIDWDVSAGRRVDITVEVDFEVTKYNRMGGAVHESRSRFRIVRYTSEELTGTTWERLDTTVKLFALTDEGVKPIDNPEAVIDEELPIELREVFFTDGDRALSFIEAGTAASTKRERVQSAIRSLLGLGIVEDALKHVRKASADFNKNARALGGDTDLARIVTRLDELTTEQTASEAELLDVKGQFAAFDEKLSNVDKLIDHALRKGDKERLQRDLQGTRKTIAGLDQRIVSAAKDHENLFRSEALARDLLHATLQPAFTMLAELRDKGKIPNATVPVLEERLITNTCICGETLQDDGGAGSKRRAHICGLIEKSRQVDELKGAVTELYYGSKGLEERAGEQDQAWLGLYTKVVELRDSLQTMREDEGRKLKALEVQLDGLEDTDIQGLRDVQREYKEQRDRFNGKMARLETKLEGIAREAKNLTSQRDSLLREQKKGARVIAELEAATDIGDVLARAYERVTHEELSKVSNKMNEVFLQMIGADPEQGAIIKSAKISKDFDILVSGPQGRILNPDRDLNGASRRALTLAFILALTRVSEVEAPNVIDTPLGMMSGYVKREVLRAAIRESSQLVLFLTHSEIAGCEEILDREAGVVITLTNPAHYPKMLVHEPGVQGRTLVQCSCNHRGHCEVCERREDAEDALVGVL